MITTPLELYFRFRRFILLMKTKTVISLDFASSTSSQKPLRWVGLELIFTMMNIYINSNLNPLTKFFSGSRNTKFENILPWNISQMIMKTIPSSMGIIISNVITQGIPFEFERKSMETETTTWTEFPNWGKAIVEQILSSEEMNKFKGAGLWESQSGIWKINHLSKVTWD